MLLACLPAYWHWHCVLAVSLFTGTHAGAFGAGDWQTPALPAVLANACTPLYFSVFGDLHDDSYSELQRGGHFCLMPVFLKPCMGSLITA